MSGKFYSIGLKHANRSTFLWKVSGTDQSPKPLAVVKGPENRLS